MTYISANCFCKSQFYIFYFCFVCGWFKLYMCIHKNKKQQHKILSDYVVIKRNTNYDSRALSIKMSLKMAKYVSERLVY